MIAITLFVIGTLVVAKMVYDSWRHMDELELRRRVADVSKKGE
jgi:hypothetical protein